MRMNAIQVLQSNGIRPSHQRVLILDTLMSLKTHPSADALYHMVNSAAGTSAPISLSTFYNTLQLFTQQGIIMEIGAPGRERHYDACTVPHTHFVCTCCHKIMDIDVPIAEIHPPEGFKINKIMLNLTGICPDCAQKKSKGE